MWWKNCGGGGRGGGKGLPGGPVWWAIVLGCLVFFSRINHVEGGKQPQLFQYPYFNCLNTRHNPQNAVCCQTEAGYFPDENYRCCPTGETSTGSPYCRALLQAVDQSRTNDDGWTRPFNGRWEDGNLIFYQRWETYCNEPDVYRMSPSVDKTEDLGRSTELYTNKLRFKSEWIAQEGLSYCIVGSSYRKSKFSFWEPLKGFKTLAEKSFDIGNHVDPTDSRKLNRFDLPNPEDLRLVKKNDRKFGNTWSDKDKLKTRRFESVWLGVLEVRKENDWTATPVPLDYGFAKRPAHPDWMPGKDCKNPYVVSVSMIESDGIFLHNYLHIKVTAEPTTQSGKNCPTGKIKLFMMEVRDQDGFPVGQFTDDVPCDQDPTTTSETLQCMNTATTTCKAHYGTKMNHVPCMFSHPKSVVHPSIFMMSATKDKPDSASGAPGGTGAGGGPQGTTDDFCRNNQDSSQKEAEHKENTDEYVTEVHATWRFAQMDEGWVSELHFATMIIEDDTPIQYYTSRLTFWDGVSKSRVAMTERKWFRLIAPNTPGYPNGQVSRCDSESNKKGCCWYYKWEDEYRPGRIALGLTSSCVNATYNTNRPYGYSARYTVMKPTFKTRGGYDRFRGHYISPKSVNCHTSISYGPEFLYEKGDEPGVLPIRKNLKEFLDEKYLLKDKSKYQPPDFASWAEENRKRWHSHNYEKTYELSDWHNPGLTKSVDGKIRVQWYTGFNAFDPILKMFDSAHQDPVVLKNEIDDKPSREYFGSRHVIPDKEKISSEVEALKNSVEDHDQEFTMKEMALDPNSRCPCPYFPTTPPPELATKAPVELEARRTHTINMMLAWVVLVPISFFAARFFKETFARVFFLQEFWWYTMHVLCLLTALLFTFGGLYTLKLKRSYGEPYEYVWTDATTTHIYAGYTTIGLFIVQLILGPFRLEEMDLRIICIGLHWLFGWIIYLGAVVTILSSAAIPSGIFSCVTFGIYVGFCVFQLAASLGMEYHMWQVDKELNLNPPRAYLPSPMMRVFHRDAPHARFRITMLVLYCVTCFLFYVAMHVTLSFEGGENSCFQPQRDATVAQAVEA